jgi:hypothetical protein
MQVLIYANVGDLTTSGATCYQRAGIGGVAAQNNVLHTGAALFQVFFQNHQNGFTVGGKDRVTMIVGGQKSISRELTAHNFPLRPLPGQNLAMSVLHQDKHAVPEGLLIAHALAAPEYAFKAARGQAGSIGTKLKHGAKYFKGVHDAIEETRKKYTFVQLYSGQPEPGDHAVGNGVGAVNTSALVVQLRALPGWRG